MAGEPGRQDFISGVIDPIDRRLDRVEKSVREINTGGVSGSDAHYVHEQNVPAIVWLIHHNLGKYPSIDAMDSAGTVHQVRKEHVDLNNSKVTWSTARIGKAVCN